MAAEGMMSLRAALDGFLEAAESRELVWGIWDCALCPADWVALSGAPDPAGPWRGRYRTALGAARIAAAQGGLEGLWAASAAAAGLDRARSPRVGDVGLMRTPCACRAHGAPGGVPGPLRGLAGGVCIGNEWWATSAVRGLALVRRPDLAAAWRVRWRIP